MKKFTKPALFLAAGLSLTACANAPYEPIVDGQVSRAYTADLEQCRQVSAQKRSTGTGVAAGAVIGGLAGGAEDESLEGAVVGAAIGGLIGSAEEKSDVNKARDQIVFNCMRGRGHNVVG